MKKLFFPVVCIFSFLLVSCSEETKPAAKKEPAKPAEPVSGQSALYKMYQAARTWSADAQVVKLNSLRLAEVTAPIGKSGAWQATFASVALGKTRTYTFSIVEQEGNLHKGVYAAPSDGIWSGHLGINTSFDIRAVSVESDAAYKTALEKAADYEKKNPNMPISFQLEKIDKFSTPVWRVIWGESVGTSNFSIYVDASLGHFLEKMR